MGVAMYNHGGTCCGVSHLYLGNSGPDEPQDESKGWDYKNPAASGRCVQVFRQTGIGKGFETDFRYEAPAAAVNRPKESAKERAAALIKQMKKNRCSGFIEAVTTDHQRSLGWGEFLEAEGFKLVGETVNSNSDNTIQMWLLETNPDYSMGDDEDDYIDDLDLDEEGY